MGWRGPSPDEIQAAYYERTAAGYDPAHVTENDEHFVGARYASYLLAGIGAASLLDVGAGTGRAVSFFLANHPDMTIVGIEPVRALINEAVAAGVPPNIIIQGRGEALPFDTGSFDAVSAFWHFSPCRPATSGA